VQILEYRKKKVVGEPDEEKPHVRFDVAGNGNQDKFIKSQAPSPDPTTGRSACGVAPVSHTVGRLFEDTDKRQQNSRWEEGENV